MRTPPPRAVHDTPASPLSSFRDYATTHPPLEAEEETWAGEATSRTPDGGRLSTDASCGTERVPDRGGMSGLRFVELCVAATASFLFFSAIKSHRC